MNKEELNKLIKRYTAGLASEEENALFNHLYLKYYEDEPMEVSFSDRVDDLNKVKLAPDQQYEQTLDLKHKKPKIKLWPRIAIAATALCVVSISLNCKKFPHRTTLPLPAYPI